MHLKSAFFVTLVVFAQPALAADCNSGHLAGPMNEVTTYYQQSRGRLFRAQLVMDAWRKDITIKADGVWGPQTAGVLCQALDTHIAIGGWGWGGPGTPAVVAFDNWIAGAAHATTNGGEFPD